ncbi:MAG: ABC transporter permease [Gemmatimonadales bacterium]
MTRVRFLRRLHRRLRALIGRPRLDTELDAELEFHLAMETERQLALGHEPAEARRRARLAFGAVQSHREATRDARGLRLLDDLWRDLRHGARSLGRRPGHTAVVLLTLGVGVGGSAAIFGAVDGVLLTPLYRGGAGDGDLADRPGPRLTGSSRRRPTSSTSASGPARSVTLTAMEPFGFDWQSDEGPVYLATWLIYEGFFETFGTQPLLGRLPRPDEYERRQSPVVVLGHAVWQRRFGGDSGVIGRVYQMDEQPRTVVAVMPAGFAVPSDDVVWSPKVLDGWERQARSSTFYTVYGRLADGVTEETATAELEVLAGQLRAEHPRVNAGLGLMAVHSTSRSSARPGMMLLLLSAVTLVLLVVVASINGLQLARAVARSREFALRGALGAGRGRVLRQLFTESLIVAAVEASWASWWRGRARRDRSLAPAGFPRLGQLRADGDVLAFALLVSAIAVMVAAALPAQVTAGLGLRLPRRGARAAPAPARPSRGRRAGE